MLRGSGVCAATRRSETPLVAELDQLVARRRTPAASPTRSSVKNSASDIGMPSSTFFSELTDGLTRFCSISEIRPFVTPARLRELALRQPVHGAHRPQARADVDPCCHGVLSILDTSSAGTRKFQGRLSRLSIFLIIRRPSRKNAMPLHSRLDRSQLEAFWMPFTANRQFKANPRLLARAAGHALLDRRTAARSSTAAPACGASTRVTGGRRSRRPSAARSRRWITRRRSRWATRPPSSWRTRSWGSLPGGTRSRVLHELRIRIGRHRAQDRARVSPRAGRGHAHAADRPRARLPRRGLRRHLRRRHGQQPQVLRDAAARRRSSAAHARPRAQCLLARPARTRRAARRRARAAGRAARCERRSPR